MGKWGSKRHASTEADRSVESWAEDARLSAWLTMTATNIQRSFDANSIDALHAQEEPRMVAKLTLTVEGQHACPVTMGFDAWLITTVEARCATLQQADAYHTRTM